MKRRELEEIKYVQPINEMQEKERNDRSFFC